MPAQYKAMVTAPMRPTASVSVTGLPGPPGPQGPPGVGVVVSDTEPENPQVGTIWVMP